MLTFTLDPSHLVSFFLVLCRVAGVLAVAPLLGSERLPARMKAALGLAVAFVLMPAAGARAQAAGAPALALLAAGELVVGLAIGFGARLVFAAVNAAGELADLQAGFGFAGILSPQSGEHASIIGQLQMALAWLIFLGANGHHVVLHGLGASLAAVPLGADVAGCGPALVEATGAVMAAAVRVAAPVVGAVLLADLALGLLTRAAPQMNLIAVGFPIKLAIGLYVTILTLPLLASTHRGLLGMTEAVVRSVLVALR